jgi:deoxyxylulose-5-phosphate synthase
VNSLEDLKLKEGELPALAAQMRQYMIEISRAAGGHLPPALVAVD